MAKPIKAGTKNYQTVMSTVRNKKKYNRKIKHKNKFEQQPADRPAKARGRACRYGCEQNHPGKLGYNQ